MSWLEAILVTVWLLMAAVMAGLRWAASVRRRGAGGNRLGLVPRVRLGSRAPVDSFWKG